MAGQVHGRKCMDGEIRQNKATKEWVIYAPRRGSRPNDFSSGDRKRRTPPPFDSECPFCPGNERMLPPIIEETPDGAGGWLNRTVPNKFSALSPEGDSTRYQVGPYLAMQGYGRHEVIIESPRHDRQIAEMPIEEVERLIEAYHRRHSDLLNGNRNVMTVIFRNHGPRAGTSLIHPHSQIIATGMVPNYIRRREEAAQAYYDEFGRCVFCDMIEFEIRHGERVILENEAFVAFVPFAAEVPFEISIMPKRHQACFSQIQDLEKEGLAAALHDVLGRLSRKLNDPDYNYTINSAANYKEGEPHIHWHLQIRPRLITRAGFEIGSGISINPSVPEKDASFLKAP